MTIPKTIADILYLFEQNSHKRRIDAVSEVQLTRGLLKEKAKALAHIEAIMLGCLPELHVHDNSCKEGRSLMWRSAHTQHTIGWNGAIDQTREAMKEKMK